MANSFEAMTGRVQDKGRVVVRMVVDPQAGRAVILPAVGQRGRMETVHGQAAGRPAPVVPGVGADLQALQQGQIALWPSSPGRLRCR